MTILETIHPDFRSARPADTAALTSLRTRLGSAAPDDYFRFLGESDGGEGLVGASYLSIYSTRECEELNRVHAVSELCPSVFLFGSNGGGDCFAFDLSASEPLLLRIPFVPLARETAVSMGRSLTALLAVLMSTDYDPSERVSEAVLGMEVHELTPVVFGGNPVDPSNKVLLSRAQHAEACTYWNRLYRQMRGSTGAPN